MRYFIRRLLTPLTGNRPAQRILEEVMLESQYLLGIGSGSYIESSGEYIIVKKLKEIDSPDLCIFDVGANKGDFVNLVLSNLNNNRQLKIHCFEPSEKAFHILENSYKENPRVVLNNMGLGKEKGTADLFYEKEGSWCASLSKRNLKHLGIDFSKSEKVSIDTIDNYCRQKNIKHIDFLKIDVEGHELDVLHGADEMFRNNLIKMVSFEFGGCNIDTRTYFRDFYYYFSEKGMRIYRITPSGFTSPVFSYKELREQFNTTNFLAMKENLI